MEEPDLGDPEAVAQSPYAASKWAALAYARLFHALYGLPIVHLRVFMVYGPGQRDLRKLVPYMTVSLLRGRSPELTSGTREVDWIYVDDVVDAFLRAAVAPGIEGASLDVGSGELVTVRALVVRLRDLVGGDVEPSFGAVADRQLERVRVADPTSAAEAMGWDPAPRSTRDSSGRWISTAPSSIDCRQPDPGDRRCVKRPAEEPDPERNALDDVAPEQPARFVPEPVHPLQAQTLHQRRCARLLLSEEAERDPHADEPGSGQLRPQRANQPLLLWEAKPDQDQRWLRAPKLLLILPSSSGSCSNPSGGQYDPTPPRPGHRVSIRLAAAAATPGFPPRRNTDSPARAAACGKLRTRSLPGTLSGRGVRPGARPRRSAGHPRRDGWRRGSAPGSRDSGAEPAQDVEVRGHDPAALRARAPSRNRRIRVPVEPVKGQAHDRRGLGHRGQRGLGRGLTTPAASLGRRLVSRDLNQL